MLGETDEGQFLASYRAVCLGPVAWLDHLQAKNSCKNVLVVLVARTAVPPLCQAVKCTFNLW